MAMPDQPAAPARVTAHSFRLLVDGVRDYAIFMLDGAGRVLTWNTGAQRLKAYGAEEIIGKHFSCFYPEEAVEAGKPARLLALAARDGRVEDEGWRVRKDGSRFWADAIITAIRDAAGVLIGFGKVTRDLTVRRRMEDQLAQSNAELERFSYSVSHDLRAPLRAINGYAQAVLEDYAAALDPEGQRFLAVIRDSAKRGGELIDALLNFSRLGRQTLAVEPVNLTELARAVVEELRKAAGPDGTDTIVDPLPPARGDRTLLRQVLANLIGTAFKFTRGRPHPHIEIGARRERQAVVYFVRDNGVGFDMQYADKLFGVFQRLHRADEFEGTGVGRALAQRIIQRHGGRSWADGQLDGGATCFVTLPPGPPAGP